jgi:hypothetical protein
MKRNTAFVIVLVFVAILGLATSAMAQDNRFTISFKKEPAPIRQIISALANAENVKVTGLDALTDSMTFNSEITDAEPITTIVDELVKPYGFRTVASNRTIHIRRANSTDPVDRLFGELDRLPTSWGDTTPARATEMERDTTPYQPPMSPSQYPDMVDHVAHGFAAARGYYPGYGGYNNGWMYPGFDLCTANPNHRDCTNGTLKIDGGGWFKFGDKFLKNVDIYIDGRNYGPASKRNNVFNRGITLPTGDHIVKFVLVADQLVMFEDHILVQSRWATHNDPSILRVDASRFKNAPFITDIVRPPREQRRAEEVLR